MSRLAAEYAISDVGLKKLCARHSIPSPPRDPPSLNRRLADNLR
jgi:hypothetical protein